MEKDNSVSRTIFRNTEHSVSFHMESYVRLMYNSGTEPGRYELEGFHSLITE